MKIAPHFYDYRPRLAIEKHIDWLVRAVVRTKRTVFDVYGKVEKEAKLRALIDELGAADYIRLKGRMPI